MSLGVTRLIIGATMMGLTALPANAAGGKLRIVDGDTIQIGTQKIRLFGIDAPESEQLCKDLELNVWNCGYAATQTLANIIGKQLPRCKSEGTDRYGRTIAECRIPGDHLSLNERMVRGGAAWAYRKYSNRYVAAEDWARGKRIGIWEAANMPAWEWRQRNRK